MKKLLLGAILLFSTFGFSQEQFSITNSDSIESAIPKKTLNSYLSDIDKFSGEKTYYSPTTTISIMKVVSKKKSNQYISISVPGSTLNYGCYGVHILFENGKKIVRPNEKVETSYSDGWTYRAFFTPTTNEINLFKNHKVLAIKLYIYDTDVDSYESESFMEASKIMLNKPINKSKK